MSRRDWHVSIDGASYGPYTASELHKIAASGRMRPSDFIWQEGMEGWQRADSLDSLFSPSAPPHVAVAPSDSSQALWQRERTVSRAPLTAGTGSKPVFNDLFTPSGRRNRKSYVYFALAAFALICGSLLPAFIIGDALKSPVPVMLALLGVVMPTLCSALFVSAQRLRDFGWPGAATLLFLVPALGQLLNLALLVVPGTIGPNRYGADPTQT